jgi:O-antigen/teichoic acid export membrane protein
MLSARSLFQRFIALLRNKTVKNGGIFAVFSFFNRGISFILLTILARYISPADYGELSLFNTLVTLLGFFVGLSTAGYLSVSFFRETKEKFKEDFTVICLITVTVTLVILFLFFISDQWLSGILKVSVKFIFLGLLISFANVFVGLNLDYFRVQEKLTWYGILSCSFALLNFGLALYLVVARNMNWHGQVYALAGCNVLFALIAVFFFVRNKLFSFSKSWATYKKIIIWGFPIIPHLASGWVKQGLDRYIIEGTHTMDDVGLFSFALTLVSIIIMIGQAFNQTNSVNLYQTLSSSDTNENKLTSLHRKEKYLSLLYLVTVIAVMVGGSIFIPIIMPKYAVCVPYFLVLSIYGFLQCIYFLYCNYLFYFDNTKQLMFITFGSSIIHFLLSFWLTRYSLYYTCLIYVFSMMIVVFLVYKQSKKLLKENLS